MHCPRRELISSPIRQFHESLGEYIKLTPLGYEHQAKKAILDRFRLNLAVPDKCSATTEYDGIWVDQLLSPVSFEPFTREEEAAINTGQFTSFQKKPHNPASRGNGRGRGGGKIGRSLGDRETSHSFDRSYPQSQVSEESSLGSTSPTNNLNSLGHYRQENEEEEILWSMPLDDSHLGTFDEKGNFTMVPASSTNPRISDDQSYQSSRHDLLPPSCPSSPSKSNDGNTSPPFKMDPSKSDVLVNESTRWLYRDPSGQVQGPFTNEKMLHWYNRKYFPESLPLRREHDILFEPLSTWKIKCGGTCPFENIPGIGDAKSPTGKVPPPLISSSPQQSSIATTTTTHTANIFAKLGIPWADSDTGGRLDSERKETGSAMPFVSSIQQKPLAQEELSFLQTIGSRSKPIDDPATLLAKSRLDSSRPASSTVPVVALATAKAIPTKPMVAPANVKPATAPVVGWAKPDTNELTKSLSEIMREEAELELTRRASQPPKSNNPKSFAETLRIRDSSLPGQSAATASGSKPPSSAMDVGASKEESHPQTASRPIAKSATSTQSAYIINNSAKAWCLSQLKPLEQTYDIQMCTILLMEFKTPQEITSFIDDNLKSNKVNLKSFAKGLIERRFGSKLSMPVTERPPEPEFVTVGRKHRKK